MNEFHDLGLPAGITALIGILVTVLRWIKPFAKDFLEAQIALTKKLAANVDKQNEADAKTHQKLDLLQADVTIVKEHILPPQID